MSPYECEEKILNVDGLNISYTDVGPKDGHLVFCVPGLLSTGHNFDFLGRELALKGYRCIAITLPGRGKSDPFTHYMQYVPSNYLPYCMALLEHEAPGQEFCWLGESLGGILGMMLHSTLGDNSQRRIAEMGQRVLDYVPSSVSFSPVSGFGKKIPEALKFFVPNNIPFGKLGCDVPVASPVVNEKMTRLILIDIGGEIPASGMDLIAEVARLPVLYETKEEAVAALQKRCRGWCIKSGEVWEHIIKYNINERKDGKYELHYDEGIGKAHSENNQDLLLWHLWDNIKQHVLLVRGGKSRILPEAVAREMHKRYSGERFDELVYESCGHVPNVMDQDHVNALVTWIEGTQGTQNTPEIKAVQG